MDTVLACHNISKTFVSGTQEIHVLSEVEMELRPGESICIQGESGSGKTTLLNILSALENADEGTVYWNGAAIPGKAFHKMSSVRRRYMGLVFQSFYLIPELNAFENVLFAARVLGKINGEDRARAKSLLEKVGLGERLKSSTLKLSGGERQRVAVARALMNRPQVVLADEPTGNLDEATGKVVMDMLLNITSEEGAALVLVTHNPEFAQKTRRRYHFIKGRMQAEG
jgi:ABC-type lipoprotein export system ATPase subunit